MPSGSGKGSVEFHVETTDFKRLFDRSSQVDKRLRNGLRRNIRQVAEVAAKDVRRKVMQPPLRAGATGRSTGLRAGIAAGVKVTILTGNTRVGVAIVGGGGGLDQGRRSLLRAYGRAGGWRHPVFGNTDVWVSQVGRPGYFYQTVAAHRGEMTRAVTAAMREAAESLEGSA